MQVVSNTTPILNLAIIGYLDLLPHQFEKVIIPEKVRQELKPEVNLPGSASIFSALQSGWLIVQGVQDEKLVRALRIGLDGGEAEAIVLGIELNSNLVLMDESDGRARARDMGLVVTGTLGVILKAKYLGQIPAIKPLLLSLQQEAGFYISHQLLQQLLIHAKE